MATTSSNVPTIEPSQRRSQDSLVEVATLVPGSEIPGGGPSSGNAQWMDEAVNEVLDHTLHGLKPTPAAVEEVVLGPTLTTTILEEGTPAEARLDTGSRVTIVCLDFMVKTPASLARNRSIRIS